MDDLIKTITNLADGLKPVVPPLAGLVLFIIGVLWMLAKNPQQKEMYTGWMINVGIGFGIAFLATSLISWFGGKVVGF